MNCQPWFKDPIGQRCAVADRGGPPCHAECSRVRAFPVVAWSTPYQRAQRLFQAVGDDLEDKQRERALAKLKQHLAEVRELVKFIEKHPTLNYEDRKR